MLQDNTVDVSQLEISSDHRRLNIELIWQTLANSYWAKNIPRELVEKSIQNSVCFGAYLNEQQIGFARVVTDQVSFAYLADVFVLDDFSGNGVAKKMMTYIMDDERLLLVRRFCLATRDAHSLYEKYGFEKFSEDDMSKFMQIRRLRRYTE